MEVESEEPESLVRTIWWLDIIDISEFTSQFEFP